MTTPPVYVITSKPVVGTAVNFAAQQTITAVIPSGTATSTAIDMTDPSLYGYTPAVVVLPAAWTTAVLSIEVSFDGTTWSDLHQWTAGAYTTNAALVAGDATSMINLPLKGVPYWRIVSGSHTVPVNQAATRTLQILLVTM